MYVPFYRGVPLTAYTASSREDVMDERGGLHDWLGDRMSKPEFHVQEVTAEVFPLDDLDLSPAFIKIDVEGSEPAAPEGRRLLGVQLSGRRRTVRSLRLPAGRSQRVLHASRRSASGRRRAVRTTLGARLRVLNRRVGLVDQLAGGDRLRDLASRNPSTSER
jgi:hypothetical protein